MPFYSKDTEITSLKSRIETLVSRHTQGEPAESLRSEIEAIYEALIHGAHPFPSNEFNLTNAHLWNEYLTKKLGLSEVVAYLYFNNADTSGLLPMLFKIISPAAKFISQPSLTEITAGKQKESKQSQSLAIMTGTSPGFFTLPIPQKSLTRDSASTSESFDHILAQYTNTMAVCLNENRITDLFHETATFIKSMVQETLELKNPLIVALSLSEIIASEKFAALDEPTQYLLCKAFHLIIEQVLICQQELGNQAFYSRTKEKFMTIITEILTITKSSRIQYELECVQETIRLFKDNRSEFKEYMLAMAKVMGNLTNPKAFVCEGLQLIIKALQGLHGTWYADLLLIRQITRLAINSEAAFAELQTMITQNKQGDWRLIYASLEALEQVIEESSSPVLQHQALIGKSGQVGLVFFVNFTHFRFQNNWRIRRKSVEILIGLLKHPSKEISELAADHLLGRKIREQDERVRALLDEPSKVVQYREAIKLSWGRKQTEYKQSLQHELTIMQQTKALIESAITGSESLQLAYQTQVESMQAVISNLSHLGEQISEATGLARDIQHQLTLQTQKIDSILLGTHTLLQESKEQKALLRRVENKLDEKTPTTVHVGEGTGSSSVVVTGGQVFGTVGSGVTHIQTLNLIGKKVESDAETLFREAKRFYLLGLESKDEKDFSGKKNNLQQAINRFEKIKSSEPQYPGLSEILADAYGEMGKAIVAEEIKADYSVDFFGQTAVKTACSQATALFAKASILNPGWVTQHYQDKLGTLSLTHIICIAQDVILMEKFLSAGTDLHTTNLHDQTLIHFAAATDDIGIFSLLESHGSSLMCIDKRGGTVLHYATGIEIAQRLIKRIDINKQDLYGFTPLMQYCFFNGSMAKLEYVQFLIGLRAKLDPCIMRDDETRGRNLVGTQVLHLAIMRSCPIEVVKILVAAGADVNYVTTTLEWPVLLAAVVGRADIIEFLYQSGAKVREHDNFWNSTLFKAVFSPNPVETTKMLLKFGTDISRSGIWPINFGQIWLGKLTVKVEKKIMLQILELYLQHGLDPCSVLENFIGSDEIRECVLPYVKDFNRALTCAVSSGLEECAKIFISRGADINRVWPGAAATLIYPKDRSFFDSMYQEKTQCSEKMLLQTLELCLSQVANIDAELEVRIGDCGLHRFKNSENMPRDLTYSFSKIKTTLLGFAVIYQLEKPIKLLISYGANPNQITGGLFDYRVSPMQIARWVGESMVTLLNQEIRERRSHKHEMKEPLLPKHNLKTQEQDEDCCSGGKCTIM